MTMSYLYLARAVMLDVRFMKCFHGFTGLSQKLHFFLDLKACWQDERQSYSILRENAFCRWSVFYSICVYVYIHTHYPGSPLVVEVVLSMEPHYHYKDIIKASKIVTEQLLITIINLILYKKKYSKSSTILGHYIW